MLPDLLDAGLEQAPVALEQLASVLSVPLREVGEYVDLRQR
jgi:hypothetical protein